MVLMSYMVHLCIILLVLGIIFLLMEMWLPGIEYFAIFGLIALAISAVLAILHVDNGWIIVVGQIIVVACFLTYTFRYMKRKQLQGKLILSETLDSPSALDLSGFLGKEGKAVTLLRPYGEVDFNGIRIQVSSNGPMIDKGTNVRVIETQSNKIIVSAIEGN